MLRLIYRGETRIPVEVDGVTPDVVCDRSLAEIEKMPVFHGNEPVRLGDFFEVTGDPADRRIAWEGDLAGVHWIGARMTSGKMIIHGNVGRHLGSQMSGGEIMVEGHAADWVGAEMQGGLIRVRGRSGHLVGAAYRGSARGMTGGTILLHGDAGNELGHTMRRGLIAVAGNVGDLAACNMLAGTILIFGDGGIRHAAGMRRGTLGLLGDEKPAILPSFRRACRYRPQAIDQLFRHLRKLDFPVADEIFHSPLELYNGDLIEGGRGELLVRLGSS